jgi:hypothetical protein
LEAAVAIESFPVLVFEPGGEGYVLHPALRLPWPPYGEVKAASAQQSVGERGLEGLDRLYRHGVDVTRGGQLQ